MFRLTVLLQTKNKNIKIMITGSSGHCLARSFKYQAPNRKGTNFHKFETCEQLTSFCHYLSTKEAKITLSNLLKWEIELLSASNRLQISYTCISKHTYIQTVQIQEFIKARNLITIHSTPNKVDQNDQPSEKSHQVKRKRKGKKGKRKFHNSQ